MAGKWEFDVAHLLTPELQRALDAFTKAQGLSKRGAVVALVRVGLLSLQQQRRDQMLESRRKDAKPAPWERYTELTREKQGV